MYGQTLSLFSVFSSFEFFLIMPYPVIFTIIIINYMKTFIQCKPLIFVLYQESECVSCLSTKCFPKCFGEIHYISLLLSIFLLFTSSYKYHLTLVILFHIQIILNSQNIFQFFFNVSTHSTLYNSYNTM